MDYIALDAKIILLFLPIFLILIGIEYYFFYQEHSFSFKDTRSSLSMGLIALGIGAIMKIAAFTLYNYLHQFAVLDLGYQWWVILLAFFAEDFTFYWHHRLSHEIRILWAAHVNHHSSEKYNYGTALRQSWTEQLYRYGWYVWMPLLGFDPLLILVMQAISIVYQFFPHTEKINRLPIAFEFFFNTPSHHRVHHGSLVQYLDKNHGGILIIWDRLFGTFKSEERHTKGKYGLTENINSYNPFIIASHEFVSLFKDVKRAPDLVNKLKYLLFPPGWSHDGKDLRAKTLQKQRKRQ